ncbi:hypothetical protein SAMN06296241_1359 [Salinimicrobium sediminis]|uniref:Uncharacterized protein n=1 Tax=Salinimicrobium sediminis TaxID=1343891 RepID=A0A285X3D5_9FLAO|nr:hypothetical protein [Salinimicrobium sediminis]SOC79822.1 hypothetical protein SAMN06296241_1359 [Salinimicrobium sediminis]
MGCYTDRLAADIANDCENLTIAGIESDILLIPHGDVDKTATTFDPTNPLLITDLVLKAGKTGFLLEGVKQTNGYNTEFVPGDDQTPDKSRHVIRGRILTPSAANRLQANKLGKGESYMAVVNKKYKGAESKDAFLVLGWDAGMYLSSKTENSIENDGAILLELSSKDNMLEKDDPKVLLETTYDTTLTAFNNKFATEPPV